MPVLPHHKLIWLPCWCYCWLKLKSTENLPLCILSGKPPWNVLLTPKIMQIWSCVIVHNVSQIYINGLSVKPSKESMEHTTFRCVHVISLASCSQTVLCGNLAFCEQFSGVLQISLWLLS
jgi:hypothetical protein